MEQSLGGLLAKLKPVLDGIKVSQSPSTAVLRQPVADQLDLAARLIDLRTALVEDDSRALGIVDDLESLLGGNPDKAGLVAVLSTTRAYDFPVALELPKGLEVATCVTE